MTLTRHATTPAAPPVDWRGSAACQGIDLDTLYSDKPTEQARLQRICRRCPVRMTCLTDALGYEDSHWAAWGIAGGLADWQRRALRVEAELGNKPNLGQAQKLLSPLFAEFMRTWRDWPADTVAGELRKHGIIASPVTVRLALWWTGGRGSVLPPKGEGDTRTQWMQVRDTCREEWARLRAAGFANRDIIAYLGVSDDALEKAVTSWRAADAEAVNAA